MSASAGLSLAEGRELELDGTRWLIGSYEPHRGRLTLMAHDGQILPTTVCAVINQPRCRQDNELPTGHQRFTMGDLTELQQKRLRLQVAHMLEAETGYRSGSPLRRASGEPRPQYDPDTTGVVERRAAKVAELAVLPPAEAELLGLAHMSRSTLERLAAKYWRRENIEDCIDGRHLRRAGQRLCMSEQLREAIYAVREESLHRSRVSMTTRITWIHQYIREKYGDQVTIPSRVTLSSIWHEWFGRSNTRQRYARSAAAAAEHTTGRHVVIHRPGQIVALDTTVLPVMVRDGVFGDPVSVHLTLALDVYTRSIVAFRLSLVSDTSIDVAMVLLDVMMPLPMRSGWGKEMEWPYPGIPAAIVAGVAGHQVAGLPFFPPETVTTDHGAVYKNRHLVEVEREIGTNLLPARVMRPTDKAAVERVFSSIQTLLLEKLPGYKGIDAADRGADVEGDAVLTIAEMEHFIATWIVGTWQNRELGEHAPSWAPGEKHSPNTLFAASMQQGGFALEIPSRDMYFRLLPVHHVAIHPRRGVTIKGLWYYDRDVLKPFEGQPSTLGGRHKHKWKVRRDPRDRRRVFFEDPDTREFHPLRWTGLPEEGEIPGFSDATAEQLLQLVAQHGLKPKSDRELLPLLLELISGRIQVERWPTQKGKRGRTRQAREENQVAAAESDLSRATSPPVSQATTDQVVVPMTRREQAEDAVRRDLRARRERVVRDRPQSPPRLGSASRLRLVPADAVADEQHEEPAT